MSGRDFGKYRLVRLLARGGMAEVYLAINEHNPQLPRRVALKKILPIYGDLREFTQLFEDEARISRRLEHGNIVRVLDHGRVDDEHFLVMEYIDGPDLEKLLYASKRRGASLSVDLICSVAGRIAGALDYAHGARDGRGRPLHLVHRDISPPNILLSSDGSVKLTDFGVARSANRISRSHPGVVRGKYAYMSPEQLRGEDVDSASDIFSFGTLLHQMITGVNPFARDADLQTMEAVVAAAPPDPRELRPDVPEELVAVVQGCLAPSPSQRFERAGLIRQELARIAFQRGHLDDSEPLVQALHALFPTQMSRRNSPVPGEDAVTQTLTEQNPALTTMELGTWMLESGEHPLISGSMLGAGGTDPRRVRMVGRPDLEPPDPSTELETTGETDAPILRLEEADRTHDPFQLGSVIDESTAGDASTLSMDDLRVARTGPLVPPAAAESSPALSIGNNDTPETMGADEEDWMGTFGPSRRRWAWLWPVAAGFLVLGLVFLLRGRSNELGDTLLPSPEVASDESSGEPAVRDNRPGTLVISSQPWAYVSVDGVMREWVTPTRLELEPGTHVIGLFHPETGWRIQRNVKIKPGETLTLSVSR